MKQIVTVEPMKSVLKEVPMPVCGDDQVLIKNLFVGVCRSEHDAWKEADDCRFGHEPMGVIAEVGKNITDYKVGDRIGGLWGGALPGEGGMTQYVLADPKEKVLIKLPDHIRDEELVIEPLACMMSAVSKAKVNMPGMHVAVVGCGFMGCGAISLLKMRGAYVIAVDVLQSSLDDAKKYGADEVYLADEAKEKFINDDFKGFDVVMEWAETDESFDLAARLTAQCGQLCIAAYHTGGLRTVDMQYLNVRAIECLSCHPREMDILEQGARYAVDLLARGVWNYTNIPTKIFPMSKFDEAQAEQEKKYGIYMKSIIDMTREDFEPYIIGGK